jgi:TorA maturation chaperone TorD/Pyruvate/2-oxoacid:ferredoxin oxidoreductase delta subunit
MDELTARQRSRTYAELAGAFSEAEPGLEREFARLFLGPGRPVAHPYESVLREGRTMGETTLDVRRRLAAEGVAPKGHGLPDHVGIELSFMAYLSAREAMAWEAGEEKEAWDLLQKQEAFLREHLGAWLPQFCRRILTGRPLTHYGELARRAETFVANDTLEVRAWLGDRDPAISSAAMDREWWTVTVTQKCTLCHTCVEMCPPGALRGVRDERKGMISLGFDATRCDGCAACERWCPEGAIRVGRSLDEGDPGRRELAQCALLACPACGRLHVPEAMVSRIVARLGSAQEALVQRLLLCYDCKATDDLFQRHDAPQHSAPDLSKGMPLSQGRSR